MRARPWLIRLWVEVRRFTLLLVGTLIAAVGYAVFQVPFNIAAGGVSGIGIIVNHFTGVSVAAFYLLVNLPLFVVGFIGLGGWRFLVNTVISSACTQCTTIRYSDSASELELDVGRRYLC